MSKIIIHESGMTFGPFSPAECFPIEQCKAYCSIKNHPKVADLVLYRRDKKKGNRLLFIEAKSSSPRDDKSERFATFISEIQQKMECSIALTMAKILKRFPDGHDELPTKFRVIHTSKMKIVFVLIINGHPREWLIPIKEALEKKLQITAKLWNIARPCVVVLNEKQAASHNIISV